MKVKFTLQLIVDKFADKFQEFQESQDSIRLPMSGTLERKELEELIHNHWYEIDWVVCDIGLTSWYYDGFFWWKRGRVTYRNGILDEQGSCLHVRTPTIPPLGYKRLPRGVSPFNYHKVK